MTQRERILSIAIAGIIGLLVLNWGFNKYRTAVQDRRNEIASLTSKQQELVESQLQGEYANRQMGMYLDRSLPGDIERAQSSYQQWLFGIVNSNRLQGANVDPTNTVPVGDLYHKLSFRVSGSISVSGLIDLLHQFYAKDYLHRIRTLEMTPNRDKSFTLELTIDAIALAGSPADARPPEGISWRVDEDIAAYRDPILNRNLYEPPNQAPSYTGRDTLEAFVGRDSPLPLTFKDPEGHPLEFSLEQESEFVKLDPRSGTLRVKSDEKREIKVLVNAVDRGYPPQSIQQELLVKVVDPPPPEEPPPPKPEFDDASQTYLTALVAGGDDWTAWMDVRTRGKTLKLRVGDEFEIGSVKGKVVDVNQRFVEIEIEDKRTTLEPRGTLREAADRAGKD